MGEFEHETLNQRFGRGRDLTFASGPGGLTIARIENRHAVATVALNGGHVLSFQPRGERLVLWTSAHSLYVEGKPIRGGIPICWPWFGSHPSDPNKPAHGFARTTNWRVAAADVDDGQETRLRLGLTDSDATRRLWPHPFDLELEVAVGQALRVVLIVRNPGPSEFTCTGALHSYFAVSDIGNVRVHGLDGCSYLDKTAGYQRRVQDGPIAIEAETDRVYVDTVGECVIADTGWRRAIRVTKQGSRTTVVWNPWAARARQLADFGDDEYRGMVCVETANAADDRITVAPGGEHRLEALISVRFPFA